MATKKIEIQDSNGNVYYPHTDASVVKNGSKTVAEQLNEIVNDLDKVFIAQSNETFDFNLATEGIHFCDPSCANIPPDNNEFGLLEVIKRNDAVQFQIFTTVVGSKYTRTENNGIWTAWQQIATTETITLALLNGWSQSFYYPPKASKAGNVVTINMRITGGTNNILCILPPQYRILVGSVYVTATHPVNGDKMGVVSINTDGSVVISSVVNNADIVVNISYSI